MPRKGTTRQRRLTDEEAARYRHVREQIAAELPEIRREAKAVKPRVLLKHVLGNLRLERERLGLSLADIKDRSGIDRGTLSKLENDADPNVTMNTLIRYAEALGKVVLVQLDDATV
jgi:DNA-binding Xre family transcriptional regulator